MCKDFNRVAKEAVTQKVSKNLKQGEFGVSTYFQVTPGLGLYVVQVFSFSRPSRFHYGNLRARKLTQW